MGISKFRGLSKADVFQIRGLSKADVFQTMSHVLLFLPLIQTAFLFSVSNIVSTDAVAASINAYIATDGRSSHDKYVATTSTAITTVTGTSHSSDTGSVPVNSICPGWADYFTDNSTGRATVFLANVSDCEQPSHDPRARYGVLYGVCNDSRTFCQYLVRVPSGMVVHARIKVLPKTTRLHEWRTDIYDGWPDSQEMKLSVCGKSPRCLLQGSSFLSSANEIFVSHMNNPALQIEFQAVTHVTDVVHAQPQRGYVTTLFHEGKLINRQSLLIQGSLDVPQGHVVMISFERFDKIRGCPFLVELHWNDRKTNLTKEYGLFSDFDRSVNIIDAAQLHIHVYIAESVGNRSCIKILFSFHPENKTPQRLSVQRLSDSLFNCSVDHYWSFRQHLDCNMKVECEDGRDETAHCPFSSPACHGWVASRHKCFRYIRYTSEITVVRAIEECRQLGMQLATIKTEQELDNFISIFETRATLQVFIGLTSGWSFGPFMYSQFSKWLDNTAIYNINHLTGLHVKGKVSYASFRIHTMHTVRYKPSVSVIENVVDMGSKDFVCETQLPREQIFPRETVAFPVPRQSSSLFTQTWQSMAACPEGHVTHAFLACDMQSQCGQSRYLDHCAFFNGMGHLPTTLPATQPGSDGTVVLFTCSGDLETIPYTLVCDFRQDCRDQSDESFCRHPPCDALTCSGGQCVSMDKRCDEHRDCLDDSDEADCQREQQTFNRRDQQYQYLINLDGKGFFTQQVMLRNQSCPDTHYRCVTEWIDCLPVYTRCNGVYDCVNHEDENDCEQIKCPGFYRCRDSTVCVHADHLCDGWPQCPQRDDEWLCDFICPASCLCQGHAFLCRQPFSAHLFAKLRYLDAKESGMKPVDLQNNSYVIRLNLAKCSIHFLHDMVFPNLQHMDLSYNRLISILVRVFLRLQNLQVLILKGNPITELVSNTVNQTQHALKILDLSETRLKVFDSQFLANIRMVQYLNISFSSLKSLQSTGFQHAPLLKQLDIRGNFISKVKVGIFDGLNELDTVFSSSYKLCCEGVIPKRVPKTRCIAPQSHMSSCKNLLRFESYRVYFWSVGTWASLGNLIYFIVHCVIRKYRRHVHVFMANLQAANFCMGIYAIVITAAHERFRGQYLQLEDTWTDSVTCKAAGFLSLLSSEVSVLIIFLITLDHLIVLCTPSFSYRFSHSSAAVACAVTWLVGLLLASIPLLPGLSHWNRYGQSAVCSLALQERNQPRARQRFRFYHVTLVFNFVLSLMISGGVILIHRATPKYQALIHDSKKPAYASVQLLVKVAVTDATAWILFVASCVVALGDMAESDTVEVGMAVFVLPLNSALNPMLCVLQARADTRRQEREERVLQILKSQLTASTKTVTQRTV